MTRSSDSSETTAIEVSVDGDIVWSGSIQVETSSKARKPDHDPAVQVDVALGQEIASLARERLQERKTDGPDLDASLEDVLWEFVDVRLSAIENRRE
jgi:hypothetical protein